MSTARVQSTGAIRAFRPALHAFVHAGQSAIDEMREYIPVAGSSVNNPIDAFPPEEHLEDMLRLVLMGFVLTAGFGLWMVAPVAAQSGAIPGGVYEAFSEDAVGCDEGEIQNSGGFTLRISADGTRVVELVSLETTYLGTPIGSVSIPADVAIAPDGTYSEPIVFSGVVIRGEGQFDGGTMTGAFTIELDGVVECEDSFTGTYVGQEHVQVRTLPVAGAGSNVPPTGFSGLAAMLGLVGLAALVLGAGLRSKKAAR